MPAAGWRKIELNVNILYEDEQLFVVVKPPGMPSQAERSTALDMVSYLKNFLARKYGKANPYVAVVHRLDRPVGGVMVYAKTPKAAAALSAQVARRVVSKTYLAVVCGTLPKQSGHLEDFLKKDGRTNLSVVTENSQDSKKAVLDYEVIDVKEYAGARYSLVKILLGTGRHHQIRVQMAHAGAAVAGDTKYGSNTGGFRQMGLFSQSLEFEHPVNHEQMHFSAAPSAEPFKIFEDEI